MKTNDLKRTAKELNELLFNPDKKDEGWIKIVGVSNDTLMEDVKKASLLLEEGELEEMSETAQAVITELNEGSEETPEEDEKPAKKETKKPGKKGKKDDEEAEEEQVEEEEENSDDDNEPEQEENPVKKQAKKEKVEKPAKEEKVKKGKEQQEVKGKSAMYHVRKLTCENPEITSKEVMAKLTKLGFTGIVESSAKIRMTEMKHCIAILQELGKIK